ncbi:hypothetical protein BV20DRAFT_930624, partial [Pilatotrama ljubarskyi]
DLVAVSPNQKRRTDPAYITINIEERHEVTLDMFKRPALPFSGVWYRPRDRAFWNQSFDKFFPPHGAAIGKAQNYNACRYYQVWLRLRARMSRHDFEHVRAAIRPLFHEILWLPYNEIDRVWNTR